MRDQNPLGLTSAHRRIRDHDLLLEVYRLAEKHVDLLESLDTQYVEGKRELLRTVARENVLDRVLKGGN